MMRRVSDQHTSTHFPPTAELKQPGGQRDAVPRSAPSQTHSMSGSRFARNSGLCVYLLVCVEGEKGILRWGWIQRLMMMIIIIIVKSPVLPFTPETPPRKDQYPRLAGLLPRRATAPRTIARGVIDSPPPCRVCVAVFFFHLCGGRRWRPPPNKKKKDSCLREMAPPAQSRNRNQQTHSQSSRHPNPIYTRTGSASSRSTVRPREERSEPWRREAWPSCGPPSRRRPRSCRRLAPVRDCLTCVRALMMVEGIVCAPSLMTSRHISWCCDGRLALPAGLGSLLLLLLHAVAEG
jgi:hypothetical protein